MAGGSTYEALASAQKRLYVLQQLEGAELSYNMPVALRLEGALDRARLEAALQALIARYDSLRTSIAVVDGEPVQRVVEQAMFEVSYEKAEEGEAEERIRAFLRPFDLERPRCCVRPSCVSARHLLLFAMHHIVSDGISMSIFVDEFTKLYAGKHWLRSVYSTKIMPYGSRITTPKAGQTSSWKRTGWTSLRASCRC
ncbi:hypothetical protein DQX05_21770 [Paenibacillus thiaminolyticus]|uniref:Condensation domain-containing protein n=1 Tax=Paenibacillus thiaminolyticus TaxID=49283 RepID=A0A3A3GUK2_PANTH|nr:hypothetical protein DQX05_21770 [Paenibacillus thiaminolyticus]